MKVLLGLLIVLLLLLQYRLWFGDGSIQEVWRLNKQADQTKAELQRLRSRNQALEAEVADLKSGLDAIEERARSELGMIDEDETFYQFVREQAGTGAAAINPDRPRTVKVQDVPNGATRVILDDTASTKKDVNGNQLIERSAAPLVVNSNDQ